jgi:hypothetical protein
MKKEKILTLYQICFKGFGDRYIASEDLNIVLEYLQKTYFDCYPNCIKSITRLHDVFVVS